MSTDASLGFSVNTSQIENANAQLDQLTQAATGATTEIDRLSNSFTNMNTARPSGQGIMGDFRRDFSEVQREIKAASGEIETTVVRAEGWLGRLTGKFRESHAAQREAMVLMHEAMSGRFSRMGGSAAIFAGNLGMTGFGPLLAVGGVMALAHGISEYVKEVKEANEATKELNQSAIQTGNYGLLSSSNVNSLIMQMKEYNDELDTTNAKLMLSKELQGGLNFDQINKYQATISKAANLGFDPKKISEMIADPSKNLNMVFDTFKEQLSATQVQTITNLEKNGKVNEANKEIVSDIVAIIDKENSVLDQQNGKLEKQLGLWNKITSGITEAQLARGGNYNLAEDYKADQRNKDVLAKAEDFAADIAKITTVIKSTDKARSEAVNAANKNVTYHAPKAHHKTEAEKAAERLRKELAREAEQLKSTTFGINQSIESITNGINKKWANKLQPFSGISKDAYDFAQSVDTINQQFDKMVERVQELQRKQGTTANKGEFEKTIENIRKQQQAALKDNELGYQKYETSVNSVMGGINEAWTKYSDTTAKVSLQSAKVFDAATNAMTDSLTDFFTTGEAGWEKYLKSIATMIEKYMVQDFLVQPFMGWLGKSMGFASSAPASAPSYNSFPVPEVPTVGATNNSNSGNLGSPKININVYNQGGSNVQGSAQGDGGQAQQMANQVMQALQEFIKHQNVKSNRQGGINKSMGNWTAR